MSVVLQRGPRLRCRCGRLPIRARARACARAGVRNGAHSAKSAIATALDLAIRCSLGVLVMRHLLARCEPCGLATLQPSLKVRVRCRACQS